jgi:hypothetical protein
VGSILDTEPQVILGQNASAPEAARLRSLLEDAERSMQGHHEGHSSHRDAPAEEHVAAKHPHLEPPYKPWLAREKSNAYSEAPYEHREEPDTYVEESDRHLESPEPHSEGGEEPDTHLEEPGPHSEAPDPSLEDPDTYLDEHEDPHQETLELLRREEDGYGDEAETYEDIDDEDPLLANAGDAQDEVRHFKHIRQKPQTGWRLW